MRVVNLDLGPKVYSSWSFVSPLGGGAVFYTGGYYDFASSNNDFSPAATHGTANLAYGAHFFVVLGATAVDEITLTVTGTSMTDAGVRAASDTQAIVIPDESVAGTYFETSKKWVGQVSTVVTTGTAKDCNYGYCKYWDAHNTKFIVTGLEVGYYGGASDATPNIRLLHHKATGWTYNAGAAPTPPAALAAMATDYNTEIQIASGEEGVWKRSNLSTSVDGQGSEGIMFEITSSGANTYRSGTAEIETKAQ